MALYKCLKTSPIPKLMGKSCSWEGSSYDYIGHIKEYHPECVNDPTRKKFKWRISNDHLNDKGILKYRNNECYFYEIVYCDKVLYLFIGNSFGISRKFRFTLFKETRNDLEILLNSEPDMEQILLPIQQRTETVSIPLNLLNNYIGTYNRFEGKLCLSN